MALVKSLNQSSDDECCPSLRTLGERYNYSLTLQMKTEEFSSLKNPPFAFAQFIPLESEY
jgi:hypothetical protein